MSELPPPPPRLPMFTATGGIRGPLGWGGTWPFGHIEFDYDHIRIWGVGLDVWARRREVRFVRIDGWGRTSIVMANGVERRVRFTGGGQDRMVYELSVRRWPVLNDRRFRRYRP